MLLINLKKELKFESVWMGFELFKGDSGEYEQTLLIIKNWNGSGKGGKG